jgi:hypothetical protein
MTSLLWLRQKNLWISCGRGLLDAQAAQKAKPFVVQPQSMGGLKPGISLDKISALQDDVDGAWRR